MYLDTAHHVQREGKGKGENISMKYIFEEAEARGRAAEREAIQEEMGQKDREIA